MEWKTLIFAFIIPFTVMFLKENNTFRNNLSHARHKLLTNKTIVMKTSISIAYLMIQTFAKL